MATFEPRDRTEWRVVSPSRAALNRRFKKEAAARRYASKLQSTEQGVVCVNAHVTHGWLARVRLKGAPALSETFERRADAEAWAREKEGEIVKRKNVDYRAAARAGLAVVDAVGCGRIARHAQAPTQRLISARPASRLSPPELFGTKGLHLC